MTTHPEKIRAAVHDALTAIMATQCALHDGNDAEALRALYAAKAHIEDAIGRIQVERDRGRKR